MISTSSPRSSTARMPWHPELERILQCPSCKASPLRFDPSPACARCGRMVLVQDGVPDFVDASRLERQHTLELEAQRNAVDKYYENEEKLSCQWDRITSDELPPLLGFPSGLVLDLGCGTGTAGAAFRRTGTTVIGADLSEACLSVAKRRLDGVVRADAVALPFIDGAFDAVVSRGALHHLASPEGALKELARVVRPGGRVLLADPREFAWLEPIKHALRAKDDSFSEDHRAYAVHEYVDMVRSEFEVEKVQTLYPLGILVAVGLDLFPLPKALPKRTLAEGLVKLDRFLNRTPLHRGGHLLTVVARRR